jgi:hypothetical protein
MRGHRGPGAEKEPRARLTASARTALGFGLLASFVGAVDVIRWIRPALLREAESSWAPARLLLGLLVCAAAALAGGLGAGGYLLWSRIPAAAEPLRPLPLAASTRAAITVAAILIGTALRFAALDRIPEPMWVDDLSLIRPALALRASPSDFADATRDAPYGVARPYGSVGVLYLEAYRASLALWGTTVLGVRFPSALAGALSLVTGTLLGRALLPAGGGMLTALVLAGLRWQLILSRWAWNMIALAPIADVAALLLVAAHRRRSRGLALAAGLVAGVGAHVYLSAWTAAAALALFALWPLDGAEPASAGGGLRPRIARGPAFVVGFALAAAPLFLLHEGRRASYFARANDHNVFQEIERTRSVMPPIAAAADLFAAPWFLADPTARHDVPGRPRLPWPIGVAVAIALLRALRRPRDAVSGLLLAHAAAALLSVVAGGQADQPNGSRFAYLSSIAAVAGAAGTLWLVGVFPRGRRGAARLAAIVAVGVVSVEGALGARDALILWPERPENFDSFHGQDTLIGRAASRWERYGTVRIEPGVGHSPLAYEAVRAYGLDPDAAGPPPAAARGIRVRVAKAFTTPDAGEGARVVERVRDGRGRDWAVVLGRRPPAAR